MTRDSHITIATDNTWCSSCDQKVPEGYRAAFTPHNACGVEVIICLECLAWLNEEGRLKVMHSEKYKNRTDCLECSAPLTATGEDLFCSPSCQSEHSMRLEFKSVEDLVRRIRVYLPNAEFDQDNDGQLVLNTGIYAKK